MNPIIKINSQYGYSSASRQVIPLGDTPPIAATDPQARGIISTWREITEMEDAFHALIARPIEHAATRERLAQLITENIPESIITLALKQSGITPGNPVEKTERRKARRVVSTQTKRPTAPPSTPSPSTAITATVSRNIEKSGIEIRFSAKPSPDTIATLKEKGYRFSKQGHWYCPHTDDGMEWATLFAKQLWPAGAGDQQIPAPTSTKNFPTENRVVSTPTAPHPPTAACVETTPTSSVMDKVALLFASRNRA